MSKWVSLFIRFFFSVVVGYFFASVFHTQSVLAKLTALDVQITFMQRISTTYTDFIGLAPKYGSVVCIGLLIAFSVCHWLQKKLGGNPVYWFSCAGGVALLSILLIMHPIMQVSLLAGARDLSGIILQVIAGILAGLTFSRLQKRPSTT
ncbi:hypothetical protein [Glaciecola sp. 1036]|uniref:hypothetical protein n=1 Tax=Alteromonadaceae TaxID=72275 RepID=UPI003D03859F